MSDSVRFDRAAEYYDHTRGGAEDADLELLRSELEGRAPVLEVGVGTGLLALPLHAEGIPLVGLDLSGPMLGKLLEKHQGRRPFPLVLGDATRMPFPLVLGDATRMPFPPAAFDAAYARWVLHLIPNWREALAEMARVVRPRGLLLINLGGADPVQEEVRHRLGAEADVSVETIGLTWGRYDTLDEAAEALGGRLRAMPAIVELEDEPLGAYLDAFERGVYSWTWPIAGEVRKRALEAVRPWAEERFGPLDRPLPRDVEVVWRAYDLG